MKPVIQEEISGCGIAASATIAGVSYLEAKRVANRIGIYAEDHTLWSDTAYVRRLLSQFGVPTDSDETPFESWTSLPDCALLSIRWRLECDRPYWHWVVFVREGTVAYVLDSKKALKRHVRTDFARMKPKWYIGVNV